MHVLVILASLLVVHGPNDCDSEPVSVRSRARNILYYRVCPEFIGATVAVYSESDELLIAQEIVSKKGMIDFHFERAGVYTVKFVKGSKEKSFKYTKDQPPPLAAAHLDYHILITQDHGHSFLSGVRASRRLQDYEQ